MADKVGFSKLLRYIPDLTNYRFTEAKRHCLAYGRGAPGESLPAPRSRHRFFAKRAFHRLYNKLAHCTRFSKRRKIHNAQQQRNYKDTTRYSSNYSRESGQTIIGQPEQD